MSQEFLKKWDAGLSLNVLIFLRDRGYRILFIRILRVAEDRIYPKWGFQFTKERDDSGIRTLERNNITGDEDEIRFFC
jgi:hypothetical protein